MSSILFSLTLGINHPDELEEVLAICKKIAGPDDLPVPQGIATRASAGKMAALVMGDPVPAGEAGKAASQGEAMALAWDAAEAAADLDDGQAVEGVGHLFAARCRWPARWCGLIAPLH